MYGCRANRLWLIVAAAGLAAAPAFAGDFGVSFHYGSGYRSCGTTYYAPAYPVSRVYYGDPYVCGTYYPRQTVVYDSCYPTVYRKTYTRSRYYSYPRRHHSVSVRYSDGHRRHYYLSPRRHVRYYRY